MVAQPLELDLHGDSRLAVLTVLVPYIGYPRTLNGLAAFDEMTKR